MNAPLTEQFQTLQEIVAAARSNLAPGPWSYLIGGAETETTVRRNRMALDSLAFRPRVLRNVSQIDSSSVFLQPENPLARAPRAHRRPGIHRRRRRGFCGARGGAVRRAADALLRLPTRPRADRGRGRHAARIPALRARRRRVDRRLGASRERQRLPRLLLHRRRRRLQPARARHRRPLHQALARPRHRGRGVPGRRSPGTRSSDTRTSTIFR